MQEVAFRDVNEFLAYLPDTEKRTVELLRKIIFSCQPGIMEKLIYNVPFYRYHKNICFIWPASVLWGKKKSYEGVRLGFTSGYLLADEENYLDLGERKFVAYRDFLSAAHIDPERLRPFIFEALRLDETAARRKKRE